MNTHKNINNIDLTELDKYKAYDSFKLLAICVFLSTQWASIAIIYCACLGAVYP